MKVSVVIPYYNSERFLPEAVESVFGQTVGDLELVLVDDDSTDASTARAEHVWETLCRRSTPEVRKRRSLVCCTVAHCGKPGRLRNVGVDAASADRIAFLDSDDLWLASKLQHQLPLHLRSRFSHTRERWLRYNAEHAESGTSTKNYKEISQKGMKHRRKGDIFSDALWKCTVGPSTVVMERSLFYQVGGFREDLRIAEDYELWLRIAARVQVAYIEQALTVKRAGMLGQEQLSKAYDFIEPFRVLALHSLIEAGAVFNAEQEKQAQEVLRKKLEIIRTGAQKRRVYLHNKHDILQYCEEKTQFKETQESSE